jgi:hypothetical protein
LTPGTINEAAQHFDRHRRTIERIYQELKPKSVKERFITDQERQDIVLFFASTHERWRITSSW